jgi:hypothetical protein
MGRENYADEARDRRAATDKGLTFKLSLHLRICRFIQNDMPEDPAENVSRTKSDSGSDFSLSKGLYPVSHCFSRTAPLLDEPSNPLVTNSFDAWLPVGR